jgi:hypothetical protein
MGEVVSHQLITMETQIQSQASSCHIYGGQSGAEKDISLSTLVFPLSLSFDQCSILINSSVTVDI